MSSEKTLEKRLREEVKKMGGLALKIFSSSFTGLPDRMVLMPGGKIYFTELKSEGKKLSERQSAVIVKLAGLGFQVYVIDCEQRLLHFLQTIRYYKERC